MDKRTPICCWRLDEHGVPIRTFPAGRLCGEVRCTTHLSVYNDGFYCARHQPPVTIRVRGIIV